MTVHLDAFRDHVVVVGSGLAGLITALHLAPQPVVIVTRSALGNQSSSCLAQGGIAAALAPDDSFELHLADTLLAGAGLCDTAAAASIIRDADKAIAALENAGVSFDHNPDCSYAFGLEAAHQKRRILHANGDGSGAAIVDALTKTVRKQASIHLLEGYEAVSLLTEGSQITGIHLKSKDDDATIATSRVVLATGGLGGLFNATTNPTSNTGQGIALTAKAGAVLADMEFVQFHPTALLSDRRPMALVSEAVRGEGARLINDQGNYFMDEVEGKDLAPRDVVARAISAQLSQGKRVYLDARALPCTFATRFPTITKLCLEANIDPARNLIPVQPAAHYHMGGVATNHQGRSSVDGLWVIGETASTGLHGANRLASNSLLEAIVMGLRAAEDIAGTPAKCVRKQNANAFIASTDAATVQTIVSKYLGILRHRAGLEQAISAILPLVTKDLACSNEAVVALCMAVSAHAREESRGAHTRTDFPHTNAVPKRSFLTLVESIAYAEALDHTFARSA